MKKQPNKFGNVLFRLAEIKSANPFPLQLTTKKKAKKKKFEENFIIIIQIFSTDSFSMFENIKNTKNEVAKTEVQTLFFMLFLPQ